MAKKPLAVLFDMEGVLFPEIWIAFAAKTGIEEFKLTTRDIQDYDELMKMRIAKMREKGLSLKAIQDVIATVDPLPGAAEFVQWVRQRATFVILSDTFYEFAMPLMKKLGMPSLFCNTLEVDDEGYVVSHQLRQNDGKYHATLAFKQMNFYTLAVGDSFNDTNMLLEADVGALFHSPESIRKQFPTLPAYEKYEELKELIEKALAR